ncbi:hypothetical protein GF325_09605 [Candidatus Bathyarchaeota archaeon]|nr:hypothetical protein [Candidatus Bathyarchaeota archaeon]
MEKAKIKQYSDREREILYQSARMCDERKLDEITEELVDLILESEDISLIKSTALGLAIFRLLNNDSLATYVGLQRLLEAGMMLESDATIAIFEEHGEGAVADELRRVL